MPWRRIFINIMNISSSYRDFSSRALASKHIPCPICPIRGTVALRVQMILQAELRMILTAAIAAKPWASHPVLPTLTVLPITIFNSNPPVDTYTHMGIKPSGLLLSTLAITPGTTLILAMLPESLQWLAHNHNRAIQSRPTQSKAIQSKVTQSTAMFPVASWAHRKQTVLVLRSFILLM